MCILVIEDEALIADFLVRGLQAEGFAVTLARNGIDGQDQVLEDAVDLVVLDLMVRGRGGLEVLAAIRAAKPALAVIILSGRAEIEDRIAGLDGGASDYLVRIGRLPPSTAAILCADRARCVRRVVTAGESPGVR